MIFVTRIDLWIFSASSRVISCGRREEATPARLQISSAMRGETREKSPVRQPFRFRAVGVAQHLHQHAELDAVRVRHDLGGRRRQLLRYAGQLDQLGRANTIAWKDADDGKNLSSDFKIGINKDLKILAYEVSFYQNAGAAADISPAVMERTLFHCTNSYFVPNVKATAYCCRTHLPPNTAFRGFGGPQGMFVIESAIAKAADALGIDASEIQEKNLLKTGNEFPYGQKAESVVNECWNKMDELYNIKIFAEM